MMENEVERLRFFRREKREKGEGDSFSRKQNFVDSFTKTGILCFRFLKCLGSASLSKKFANFMMKSETESLRFFKLWGNWWMKEMRKRGIEFNNSQRKNWYFDTLPKEKRVRRGGGGSKTFTPTCPHITWFYKLLVRCSHKRAKG